MRMCFRFAQKGQFRGECLQISCWKSAWISWFLFACLLFNCLSSLDYLDYLCLILCDLQSIFLINFSHLFHTDSNHIFDYQPKANQHIDCHLDFNPIEHFEVYHRLLDIPHNISCPNYLAIINRFNGINDLHFHNQHIDHSQINWEYLNHR